MRYRIPILLALFALAPCGGVRAQSPAHDSGGYRLVIEAPLDNFPSGDVQADTQRINDIFAAWVTRAPEQYNWIHRRFKTRPDGAPSPY